MQAGLGGFYFVFSFFLEIQAWRSKEEEKSG